MVLGDKEGEALVAGIEETVQILVVLGIGWVLGCRLQGIFRDTHIPQLHVVFAN